MLPYRLGPGQETLPTEGLIAESPEELSGKSDEVTASLMKPASRPEKTGLCRIDFAQLAGRQLLLYGWVLDFTKLVDKAAIDLGGVTVDLSKQAIGVQRPDVAAHFSLETGNEEHGFYALIDLPVRIGAVDSLRLAITFSTGETVESFWPVAYSDRSAASALAPHVGTLKKLLPYLTEREAKRLLEFAWPALGLPAEAESIGKLPPPLRFGVDLCCLLENRILVIGGWLFDPLKEVTLAEVRIGGVVFDLLEHCVSIVRPDLEIDPMLSRKRETARPPGFVTIQAVPMRSIPWEGEESEEATFTITVGTETAYLSRLVTYVPQDARRDFLALIGKLDPDPALALCERMEAVLSKWPEERALMALVELIRYNSVERLPPSLQNANPRYVLHLDQATLVPGHGVLLVGWSNAESPALRVVCHCGPSSFVVSDHWARYSRLDVSSHLTSVGILVSDHNHGYCCYVPLSLGDAPYYLSVEAPAAEVRRMRVTVIRRGTLETVRALLNPFDSGNGELRVLMERHIGPAVRAIWAARQRGGQTPVVHSYGPRPEDPSVSVIVPLYGRHDFAEYQMALFADDPQFQSTELIYVVDDPGIVKEFYARCADLYGIYQVPFVVTHPGANLGFAGANNFAAGIARGKHLLFMNSDVLPKRSGWLGELQRIHGTLAAPGLLGVKLLYEDGTVQHAGMAFRRLAAWDNLWTNHHPSKGLSPIGLTGVRPVPAVTAACALMEAQLYRQLGGFSEDYIIGDFEDSDLCLQASLAGRQNYVALDVELYHLERQSQNYMADVGWRTNITVYNCLLHNRRWEDRIERMREEA